MDGCRTCDVRQLNEKMMKNNWHAKTSEEVARELALDPRIGLTDTEYKKRLKHYGHNLLKEERRFVILRIFLSQISSPLVLILVAAGGVALVLKESADAFVILIAIIINAAIGIYQEGRADRAFEKLKSSVKKYAIVVREGREHKVESSLIVPGDVVIVRAGDGVVADARIMEAKGLAVNESVLTGEWLPREKGAEKISADTRLPERINMLFAGTTVSEGWGRAVVVASGEHTEFGKIAEALKGASELTPFQNGVRRLSHIISGAVIAIMFFIFSLGLLRGEEPAHMFLTAIAVAVAAVPEGLPIATTVILAIGMGRILAKGGLIRNMAAAETLGSTSVILTDKTGTLTKGDMQVADIIVSKEILRGETEENKNRILATKSRMLEIAILSADAFIENPEAELADWVVQGKPTEKAIFMAGIQAGLHPQKIQNENLRIDFFPFDAERRFAASLNNVRGGSKISAAGAPEKILEISGWIEGENGVPEKLTVQARAALARNYQEATSRGSRVIGVAYRTNHWQELSRESSEIFREFVFMGFISFHDPLRHDVRHAISEARAAGLKPIMMTGDHRSTAAAVGLQAGLFIEDGKNLLDGEELEKMDDAALDEKLPFIDGYARVLPHQKLRIVEAWQRRNAIVAMTGDGVNDAPALKRADIGIALGSGTDVAKEASDLVLTNNSFSVIVAAIEEGRVIMDNLRKVITFLLATGFTEVVLVGGSLIFGLPLPILPAQILWSNIVGEGFMNFAFAFEPKEKDVMSRDPKEHSSKKIITREMMWIIFGIGILTDVFLFALFLIFLNLNYPLEKIRTIIFAGLAVDSMFFVYAIRSLRRPIWKINIFSNKYLLAASGTSVLILVAALTLPQLKTLLSLSDIMFWEAGIIVALGFFDLAAIEIAKYVFYWRRENVKITV